jgi:zinc D-Ala-D-Ala carboxypeptidase
MTGAITNLHPDLMKILTRLETQMGFELTINSGYRTPEHNEAVGGVPDSEHMDDPAQGADVFCHLSATRFHMLDALYTMGVRRIGIGPNFIHVGISTTLPTDVAWTYYPVEKGTV